MHGLCLLSLSFYIHSKVQNLFNCRFGKCFLISNQIEASFTQDATARRGTAQAGYVSTATAANCLDQ
ncbi:hypothetical protein ASPCAL07098 [Aspergillus calidoustus]|uniref:Uncharacterized protein n=1 Tax=Aspergillus calidoustus TaxID=454130 RepID=A0A0U5G1U6_ASPCI|nr:hypothetical protein ASPCAL07098 [Aspergillus calidoustus]